MYLFNDAGNVSSLIDRVLCSKAVNSLVYELDVLLDFITSDHKPVTVVFIVCVMRGLLALCQGMVL
jgi:exonuclease III